jgi:hypothetical protein
MNQGTTSRPNSVEHLAARVGSSVVGVVSAFGRGSGYVALPNGLVVTSLKAVGYAREALLELPDDRTVAAVVVRANVALDVALLAPLAELELHPLPSASRRLEPGGRCVVVGRVEGALFVATTAATAVGYELDGFEHVLLDRSLPDDVRGAPVVDAEGHVLGLAIRPRSTRATAPERVDARTIDRLVLPVSAFEGGLFAVARPRAELVELLPEYGCPRCDTVFEPAQPRCLACGSTLPLAWVEADEERAAVVPVPPALRRALEVAIRDASRSFAAARVGAGVWCIEVPTTKGHSVVEIRLCPGLGGVSFRVAVGRLPADGGAIASAVYRHLLSSNDAPRSHDRLGVVDDGIYLSRFEPVESLARGRLPELATSVAQASERVRARLAEAFGVEPPV